METWILPVLLGVGLAAASGLRAFLPLLAAALAARFGLFGVELNGAMAWLSSDAALVALGLAAVLEMAGDKLPVVDHALDVVGTIARPTAGALAAWAVLGEADPVVAGIVGVILGAPTALAVHGAKSGTRAVANVSTAGLAAPVVSTAEDGLALGTIALALLAPLLVPLLLALILWAGWRALQRRRRGRATVATPHAVQPRSPR